jgi:hypothetical protein
LLAGDKDGAIGAERDTNRLGEAAAGGNRRLGSGNWINADDRAARSGLINDQNVAIRFEGDTHGIDKGAGGEHRKRPRQLYVSGSPRSGPD